MAKQTCDLCGQPKEEAPAIHDVVKCENTELLNGRQEIKKLKASTESWKDAWYECRRIIGWLWWHHKALHNDEIYQYYKKYHDAYREQ